MWKPALAFAAGLAAGWTLCLVTAAAHRDATPAPAHPESRSAPPVAELASTAPAGRPMRGTKSARVSDVVATASAAAPSASEGDAPGLDADAVALLAEIESCSRDGADGKRVFEMAQLFPHLGDRLPSVPPRLVQELMARGGDFDKAGDELFRCMSRDAARAEVLGLATGAPSASAWGTPEHREVVASEFFRRFMFLEFSDDDVRALVAARSPAVRAHGIGIAVNRGLLAWDAALVRARTDPDPDVRNAALEAAVSAAKTEVAARDAVGDEILAFARSNDPLTRAFGIEHLGDAGAKGAALARDVIDQGGLDADAYESAVKSLIAARRFDRLAPEGLDDESRERLVTWLYSAYSDDPSTRPQVVEAIRSMGIPTSAGEVEELMAFAEDAGALDLVFDAAKEKAAPVEVRSRALAELLAEAKSRPAAIRLAGEVLADPATTASQRRVIVEEIGDELIAAGDDGVALLRRVAEHDANAQVRGLAARRLRDAEK